MVEEKDIKFSGEIIGEGAQGIVSKGKYLGSDVAIKSLQRGKYNKNIKKEIKILEKLRHPNIISIMSVCLSVTQFHIVMEYFVSYSLWDAIFNPIVKTKLHLDIKKYFGIGGAQWEERTHK